VEAHGYADPYDDYELEDEYDRLYGEDAGYDPTVASYDERLDHLIEYLQDRELGEREAEHQRRTQALEQWIDAHPDVNEGGMGTEVAKRVQEIAETVGDERLLTDLPLIEETYQLVKAEAEKPSYDDRRRADVRAAGREHPDFGTPMFDQEKQASDAERAGEPQRFGERPEPTFEERVTEEITERGGDPDDYGERRRASVRLAGDGSGPMRPPSPRREGALGEIVTDEPDRLEITGFELADDGDPAMDLDAE
jgi:hypothetical protein